MLHDFSIEYIKSLLCSRFHIETQEWFIGRWTKIPPASVRITNGNPIKKIMIFMFVEVGQLLYGSLWIWNLKIGFLKSHILPVFTSNIRNLLPLTSHRSKENHSRHNPTIHIVVITEKVVRRMFSGIDDGWVFHHMFADIDVSNHFSFIEPSELLDRITENMRNGGISDISSIWIFF